jgi:hypothetical protein
VFTGGCFCAEPQTDGELLVLALGRFAVGDQRKALLGGDVKAAVVFVSFSPWR